MPNQVRVLIVLFLLPLLANSQVARFMGRYDVSTVTYMADSTWQLSGTFIDLTGSYTGLSCDTNDKIIQRGYDSLGRIVFDRYRIMTIVSQTVNDLVVNVRSDYTGGIQNSSNMPFTGSFPIASAVSDTSSLTYRTSMYQNLIDPDYDAALDNLNLYEAKASIISNSHWDLNGQDIHNNNSGGVAIRTDSATTNFTVAGSTNWIPSVMDSASIDDGISQSEMSRLIVYHDTNSAWFDWAYGSGSMLADGYEGQFLEIVSDTIGVLYLKNNEPTNTVVYEMSMGDNITLKYTNNRWEEWARTDHTPFFSCGDTGSPGITYIGMIGENGISVTPASISSNGTFTVRNTAIDSTFIKAGTLVKVDSAGNAYTISIDSLDFITTITPEGLNSVMKIDNHTEYEYIGYEKVNAIINENNPAFSAYNSAMTPAFMGVRNDGHAQTDEGLVGLWGSGYDGVFDHVDSVFIRGRLLQVDSIYGLGARKVRVEGFAAANWSATSHPTYLKFSVTDTLLAREAMRINRDRTVKLANIPPRSNVPTQALVDSAGTITKYHWPTTYVHPSKAWADKSDLTGNYVISNLTIDALGHPTNWTTRQLTIPAAEAYFGTVTSIGITAGTGISSSGGPITSSGNITVTNTAPEATTVANAGDGAGQVYKSMTGSQINLKTIKAGANVTVTNNANDITIAASTGAGGNTKYVHGTANKIKVDSAASVYTVDNITRDSTHVKAGTGGITVDSTFGAGGKVYKVNQTPQIQSDWTQANSGLLDYIKNKPTIPAAQIQSDWNQMNNALLDYIKNKPTIPAAEAYFGTVTSIATTAPITGGTITTSGTIGINSFAGSTPGAVPTSAGGTLNYLRADGSWATPPDNVGAAYDSLAWYHNTSRNSTYLKYPNDRVTIGANSTTANINRKLWVYGSQLIKDTLFFSPSNHWIAEGYDGSGIGTDNLWYARYAYLNGVGTTQALATISNDVNATIDSTSIFAADGSLVIGHNEQKSSRLWVDGIVKFPGLTAAASADTLIGYNELTGELIAIPMPAIGGGTVTSVGLALPSQLTVSNSPVTTAGTLTAVWGDTIANKIFAGPATGGATKPKFRSLVNADLIGAVKDSTTLTAGTGINVTGTRPAYTVTNSAPDQVVSLTQGGATTISGTYPNFTISSTDNNTTYSAGFGMVLNGTTFGNTRYWKGQDTLKTTLTGFVKATAGVLSADNSTYLTTEVVKDSTYIRSGTGIRVDSTGTPKNTYTVTNILPEATYIKAGTGISLANSDSTHDGYTITNSAPDQTVAISSGTGINVTGTYPNFTVANTAPEATTISAGTGISIGGTPPAYSVTNTAPDQTVGITGAGINVVTGTYPNFTVTGTEVDGSTTNEIQTPAYTASTRLIGLSGTATTAEIPLFATNATTPGLVTGSNSVGATYFLNGTGAWSVPATGALYDSLSWYYKASRNSIYPRYSTARVTIGGNTTTANVNRKLHLIGSQYVKDTIFWPVGTWLTERGEGLATNFTFSAPGLYVNALENDASPDSMLTIINGNVYRALIPTNYWTQSSGKLSPATSTDDIVATDSLRTEGAALVKSNLTVKNIIETQDSISIWHGVKNYRSLLTLDDDVAMAFFDNAWGHGRITAKTGATYAEFSFNDAGYVILYSASADVTNTDTDDKTCIYPSGTGHIIIKNRLGDTQILIINIEYAIAR